MRRILLGGVAAVAALLLASLVVITLATRDTPSTASRAPAPPPPAGEAPRPAAPVGAPVDLGTAPLGGVPLPPPVVVTDQRPPPPPPGSWEAVPVLASRRGAMGIDLEEIQPRLAQCFTPDVEARYGATPPAQVKDTAPLQDDETTVLVLQIEVSGDRLRVLDAPFESRGRAGDGTIACAQAVLRGQTAPAAGLRPGRFRMRFALVP
ncbi:MAG TPA: hypothetical protein VIW03_15425 [Anaeromyxobacter sp.]